MVSTCCAKCELISAIIGIFISILAIIMYLVGDNGAFMLGVILGIVGFILSSIWLLLVFFSYSKKSKMENQFYDSIVYKEDGTS